MHTKYISPIREAILLLVMRRVVFPRAVEDHLALGAATLARRPAEEALPGHGHADHRASVDSRNEAK